MTLAQMGELSAASRALVAEPLAALTGATLAELRDPARRPPTRQVALSDDVVAFRPAAGLTLCPERLSSNLRRARRGAAAGPTGCTNEHLRVLLDNEEDTRLLYQAAQMLAAASLPPPILDALALGHLVALQKPNGRVRGLVVGDVFRRLVARTLAQQFAARFQEAFLPFQYALSTRAGAESVARALRVGTELDPRATALIGLGVTKGLPWLVTIANVLQTSYN